MTARDRFRLIFLSSFTLFWDKALHLVQPQTLLRQNNRLWGAEKIQGELLKLGIQVSKRTIQQQMKKARKRSGQTWGTLCEGERGSVLPKLS